MVGEVGRDDHRRGTHFPDPEGRVSSLPCGVAHVSPARGRRGRARGSRSFAGLAPAENLELPFVIELCCFIHFRQTATFEGRGPSVLTRLPTSRLEAARSGGRLSFDAMCPTRQEARVWRQTPRHPRSQNLRRRAGGDRLDFRVGVRHERTGAGRDDRYGRGGGSVARDGRRAPYSARAAARLAGSGGRRR